MTKLGKGLMWLWVDPAGWNFKAQKGNGPVKGVDEISSWLIFDVCELLQLAEGSFSIEAPLIYIVCLHGWPALLLSLSLLLVAACY